MGGMKNTKGKEAMVPASPLCALISRQPFFKGLNQRQFEVLATVAMEREFKAGDYILKEGEPANRFYLIMEGKVELLTETKNSRIPVQILGAGDDLGWSWLFPPYYFQRSAQALAPTRTIFFYGTRLRQLCEDDHDLGYEIMKRVAQVAIRGLNTTMQALDDAHMNNYPASPAAPKRK